MTHTGRSPSDRIRVVPETSARPSLVRGIVVAVVVLAMIHHTNTPPAAVPASAPPTEFSAERAMRHVRAIAVKPHPIGSAEANRVRGYILGELTALGIRPDSQDVTAVGTRYQELGHVRNVMARIPGTTPGGKAIMLMSHYDGVPAGPAASDDGSGVSVVLETLRALKAGPPLTNDVIALFTDGEEAGLLGAAAFVREHPWAKDVAVTLNFEARGTTGRALMFETGPGNLDLVRVMKQAPDVSASSLFVTVYRLLNNDTDLSEESRLKTPALNWAFADGVERYHTTRDDAEHINPASMQHEGAQALSIVRTLGREALPRAVTGDAVFSDLPMIGIVAYPESAARPLALVLLVLLGVVLWRLRGSPTRWARDTTVGVMLTIVSAALAGATLYGAGQAATAIHRASGGAPSFSAVYAMAFGLVAFAVTLGCWAFVRRWCAAEGTRAGVLIVFAALSTYVSFAVPGASFLFAWPLAAALLTELLADRGTALRESSRWLSTGIAVAVLLPFIAFAAPVMLGVVGAGGIAMGVFVALLTLVLLPQVEVVAGSRRVALASLSGVAAIAAFGYAALTVRATDDRPQPSMLAYLLDADTATTGAWLATVPSLAGPGSWAAQALGREMRVVVPGDTVVKNGVPMWLSGLAGGGGRLALRDVPRVPHGGPSAELVADSTAGGQRHLTIRVRTAPGALNTTVGASRTAVRSAAVDGRMIDTTRFRYHQDSWRFTFAAPPDSGFVLALTLPAGASAAFELLSRYSGLPAMAGVVIPARPSNVVPVQTGDVTIVRRRVVF